MNHRKYIGILGPILVFATLALALSVPGAPGRAHAQGQQGVTLTSQFGLGGYCKADTWIPVHVTLENSGPEVDGRVQVSTQNSGEGDSIYGQDVLLPTTSRKESFLYFYPNGSSSFYNLRISLLSKGGQMGKTAAKEIARKTPMANCIPADSLLIGVMADSPAAFDILNDIQPLSGIVRVSHLQPRDLPDRPQGWAMLDALVVSSVDTGTLTPAQRQSLELWLANGGKLLVTGGPQWQAAASGLQDVLPVDVSTTRTVSDLSSLTSYLPALTPPDGNVILAAGRPRAGAVVLAAQGGVPLLTEKQVGFGKVIYLAADPSLQPLNTWDGMRDLYGQLIGSRSARPRWIDTVWEKDSATRSVSALRAISLPSYAYICGWLLLYVVAIGPLNFLFLKRFKRRELAWITIPVLVIGFSGVAYLYGAVYRGPRPILNRIAVVQSWDGIDTAETRALIGIYSPRRSPYTLAVSDRFMFFPFETSAGGPQSGGDWLAVQDGDSALMPDVRVDIGGMQTLYIQGNSPALKVTHNLVYRLSGGDSEITGTVTNASLFDLHDVTLVTVGGMQTLGDIPVGQSKQVSVTIASSGAGSFYNGSPFDILGYDQGGVGSDENAVRRTELLQAAVLSTYRTNLANGGVYLMGWADQPVVPLEIQHKAFDAVDAALYISRLDPSVKMAGPEIKLTPGLFLWEASDPNVSPYGAQGIPPGGYVLQFHPSFPLKYSSVERLVLDLQGQASNSTGDVVDARLWDYQSGQWVQLEIPYWGEQDIPNPAHYVGPGGEIRLRLDNPTSNWVEVRGTGFTLVVHP